MRHLDSELQGVLRREISALSALGGGDVADAFRVDLRDGTRVFAKTHPAAPC